VVDTGTVDAAVGTIEEMESVGAEAVMGVRAATAVGLEGTAEVGIGGDMGVDGTGGGGATPGPERGTAIWGKDTLSKVEGGAWSSGTLEHRLSRFRFSIAKT